MVVRGLLEHITADIAQNFHFFFVVTRIYYCIIIVLVTVDLMCLFGKLFHGHSVFLCANRFGTIWAAVALNMV